MNLETCNQAAALDEVRAKVVIVAGAASGRGKVITELFHARGAKIVAEDINPAVAELARPGIVPLVADIAQDGSAEKAVALALQHFGRIDILVNNAAVIINKLVVDMTRADWERIIAVNTTGAFLHSREAVKAMIPQKSGAIVNIASYAAYFAFPSIAAYTASKGALAQLTRTLALEVIGHGIRVNNFNKSLSFYRQRFDFLGFEMIDDFTDMIGWRNGRTAFWITGTDKTGWKRAFRPDDVGLHHYAFELRDRQDVDELQDFLKKIDTEIVDPASTYYDDYYAVYFRDPDGMKLEGMTYGPRHLYAARHA